MSTMISFEHPLNERIRTFIRIEQLFKRCAHYINKESIWDSHCALYALIELSNLTSRGDLKRELLQEIKRQLNNLEQLNNHVNLDKQKLNNLISNHNRLIDQVDAQEGQLSGYLKNHDFLNSVKQRITIPGGTCDFDLPAYHYWLNQDAKSRQETLLSWLQPFASAYDAITQCLNLIRDSVKMEDCMAAAGFYQCNLDPNQPNQLLRILVDKTHQCFPEISAGKHRYSIRFLSQTNLEQCSKQTNKDIYFKLSCCSF